MNDYIKRDVSVIGGVIFNYLYKNREQVCFYYMFNSDYFIFNDGNTLVSFKFMDINKSREVEIYIPRDREIKSIMLSYLISLEF